MLVISLSSWAPAFKHILIPSFLSMKTTSTGEYTHLIYLQHQVLKNYQPLLSLGMLGLYWILIQEKKHSPMQKPSGVPGSLSGLSSIWNLWRGCWVGFDLPQLPKQNTYSVTLSPGLNDIQIKMLHEASLRTWHSFPKHHSTCRSCQALLKSFYYPTFNYTLKYY